MMAEKKVVQIAERQGRQKREHCARHIKIYFANEARLQHCLDVIEEDYKAGLLTSNKASGFFNTLFARYERERKAHQE